MTLFSTFTSPSQLADSIKAAKPLGVFAFSTQEAPSLPPEIPLVEVGCARLNEAPQLECWYGDGAPRTLTHRGIQLAEDGRYLFGSMSLADSKDCLEEEIRNAYRTMAATLQELGYGKAMRIWNYLPDINETDPAGLERYRAFSLGRAKALLEDCGYAEAFLPAGTCVGCSGDSIRLAFLACRQEQVVHMENPRQVPAYQYPKQYGPKPPSFSRATYVGNESGLLLVSGTAAVVGHVSKHPEDVEAQCRTTLENLQELVSPANLERYGIRKRLGLEDLRMVKVYLRNKHHREVVQAFFRDMLGEGPFMLVESDICRADLLVEIEGWIQAE